MFYAVAAKNALGIFDNKNRLDNAKEYLSKPAVKLFNTYLEAFHWASDLYNDLQEDYDNKFLGLSTELRLNWLLFRKNIREKNISYYGGTGYDEKK